MIRPANYLRQSLDRDGTQVAVARQRKDNLALIKAKGWPDPTEYLDNSKSASNLRKPRPAYQRMLADIEAGHINAIVVWDLDRLYRQPIELENLINLADRHGVQLATVTGDVDLSTDNGRLFARIKGAVARSEVERKSARQKSAHRQRAADGRPWGTRRSFGFNRDMTHHLGEAPLVRQAYDDILAGMKQTSIATMWNALGVLGTTGSPWRQSSLRQMLLKPRNAGLITYHGQIIGPGNWEPIVPEDVWRAAVDVLNSHPQHGQRASKYLLSGLPICGLCKTRMTSGYTARKVRIYVCPECSRVGRKADAVDQHVADVIEERLTHPDAAELLVDHDRPDIGLLQSEAQALRIRLQQIAEAFADGAIGLTEWKAARDRAERNLRDVEQKMLPERHADILGPLLRAADPRSAWRAAGMDRQRAVIDALVQITIMPTGKGNRFDPDSIVIDPRS